MVKVWMHMAGLFRLVRWPNLMIVAAVQLLVWRCVMAPLLRLNGMELQLPTGLMILVITATVLIAAGGYAINDYFDRKIDRINKPEKVVIGKLIHPRHVMAYHMLFTFAGVLLGTWAAFRSGLLFLSLLYIMAGGMLWFYSTTYKKQLLLGTIIVALLTAMVPFMVLLFEIPLLLREYGMIARDMSGPLLVWVLGFSVMAFLLNLAREMVKDAEDFEGDHAFGKHTLPVVIGIRSTKWVVTGILLLLIIALVLAYVFFIPDRYTLVYFVAMLILPLIIVMGIINRATTQKSFHLASMMLKFVMLAGILYMVLVNFIIRRLA